MNFRIRRILVAIRDVHHAPRRQLRKAATLARASGARLELFHAIVEPVTTRVIRRSAARPSFEEAQEALARRSLELLKRMERSTLLQGVRATSSVVWDYPPHEAIIRRAVATKADLVLAAAQPRGFGNRLLLTNTDWELIRQCPCAVLLVKSSRDYNRPVVLAAVDPFHTHAKPAQLDHRILTVGGALARTLRGELHVCHAYMPLPLFTPAPVGQPLALTLPPEFEDMHTKQVAKVFDQLAARAAIPAGRRHLRMGETRSQLLGVARRTGAAILVMGAVSRSALRRAFIGSTAESTLDWLSCDALIVKPKGFRSPVAATRQARSAR
jgi:universal stress protein E